MKVGETTFELVVEDNYAGDANITGLGFSRGSYLVGPMAVFEASTVKSRLHR